MIPPVSLPSNGGVQPACAGAHASIPHTATRLAAPILRIANSLSLWATLERNGRRGKNGGRFDADLAVRCCRRALDLAMASRHRPRVRSSGGLPMRDLFTSLKRLSLGTALGVLFGM